MKNPQKVSDHEMNGAPWSLFRLWAFETQYVGYQPPNESFTLDFLCSRNHIEERVEESDHLHDARGFHEGFHRGHSHFEDGKTKWSKFSDAFRLYLFLHEKTILESPISWLEFHAKNKYNLNASENFDKWRNFQTNLGFICFYIPNSLFQDAFRFIYMQKPSWEQQFPW